jgi:hypothetical protein
MLEADDMTEQEMAFIWYAVNSIQEGKADKLEQGKILVYKCGKVIRIDIGR